MPEEVTKRSNKIKKRIISKLYVRRAFNQRGVKIRHKALEYLNDYFETELRRVIDQCEKVIALSKRTMILEKDVEFILKNLKN
jgi:DNA polymerase III delta subunit